VLKAKAPRRATGASSHAPGDSPEFQSAATILEDSGPSQADIARALADRKKASGVGLVGANRGAKPGSTGTSGGNTRIVIILAAVAVVVGGVLAFVLAQ